MREVIDFHRRRRPRRWFCRHSVLDTESRVFLWRL